jgi:hypothetical protein
MRALQLERQFACGPRRGLNVGLEHRKPAFTMRLEALWLPVEGGVLESAAGAQYTETNASDTPGSVPGYGPNT